MPEAPASLILDLLEWVARSPRSYAEVMAAWRTSCPRLPVWEDAVDEGLVQRECSPAGEPAVVLTAQGWARLRACRPATPQATAHDVARAAGRSA